MIVYVIAATLFIPINQLLACDMGMDSALASNITENGEAVTPDLGHHNRANSQSKSCNSPTITLQHDAHHESSSVPSSTQIDSNLSETCENPQCNCCSMVSQNIHGVMINDILDAQQRYDSTDPSFKKDFVLIPVLPPPIA